MKVRAGGIYVLMIKVNKFFSFLAAVFSKGNREHVLCVSIELKHESKFGEREMLCERKPQASVYTAFPSYPKLSRVRFREVSVFCIMNDRYVNMVSLTTKQFTIWRANR